MLVHQLSALTAGHGLGDYKGKPRVIIIEHMEEYPTRWLLEEYTVSHLEAERVGFHLVVAGVRDPRLQALLTRRRIAWVEEHSWEAVDRPGTIVLDMWAQKDLEPEEASAACCFVVGGIMGDHPPRRRGLQLSWRFDWASTRRMGQAQMTIHTAVWAVTAISRGTRVEDLPIGVGGTVEVETAMGTLTVELPYAYPIGEDGKPRVPERIARLLARGVVWDEEYL